MRPGDVVADRFQVEHRAGEGGMAAVYRAVDRQTGAPVALKITRFEASDRFSREARLLQELDHPGIVRYIAHGTTLDGPFLAMEWLEGEDLKQRLARQPLTVDESVHMACSVAAALAAAHARNIIHRDIKPANVWLVGGDPSRVKLLDFGIARVDAATHAIADADADDPTHRTAAGVVLGTPAYMAPEQIRGASTVDARADVYSLACVLFRCLAGRTPFVASEFVALLGKAVLEQPPRLSDFVPTAPAALDDLIARSLAKDPAERPQSATELARELQLSLEAPPDTVRPSVRSAEITAIEQRLVSVILFRGGATEAVRSAVEAHGARLEPLIGGSAVVLLEGHDTAADEARRAAACALALRDEAGVQAMALATGRAQLGNVPIGEVLDRAAALLAEGAGGIRVSDVTSSLLGDSFDTRGGLLGGPRQTDGVRTLLGQPTPTLGREPELGRLEGIVTECVEEPCAHAVLVVGPAGIGKSRVRYELLRRVSERRRGIETWIARADPVGAGSSFGLVAQIVRRAAGVLEGEPLEVRRNKLRARVGRCVAAGDVDRVTCFLGEVIGAPFDDAGNPALRTARRDARVMFDQVRLAWEELVAAECRLHPVVIVLEDLHWGDRASVALCDGALRVCEAQPLLVLSLARPEVLDRFPDLFADRDLEKMTLRELSKRSAEKLAAAALGERASPDVVTRIVERAAGNAFYLEELIRAAAEGRKDTPETALLMVQSRLEAMEPEARRVLRGASIFGRAFWAGGVAALVGGAERAAKWLRVLEEREIVEPRRESRIAGEREFVFRHALVQEAAHAMLTEEDKGRGHALVASWLERHGETDASALAEHLEHAGARARAVTMWTRAAEQALEGNDYSECIERTSRAIACGAEGHALGALHVLRARAASWRGDNGDALREAETATSLLPAGSEGWADAVTILAMAYRQVGRASDVGALADRLLELLPSGAAAVVGAAARVADALLLSGRGASAERMLAAIEQAAGRIADPTTRAWLEHARGLSALFAGRSAEFLERYFAIADAYLEAGDLRSACHARMNIGYGLSEIGMLDESERTLRATLADARRLGLANTVASAEHNLGWTLHRLGRNAEAAALERDAVSHFAAHGDRRLEAASRFYMASILASDGDAAAAEAEARRAAEIGAEASRPVRACALSVLANVLRQKGDAAAAVEASREAVAWVDAHGADEGEGIVRLALAEALAAAGDHGEAMRAIARAKERLGERAAAIHRDDWRRAFLEDLPEHARTSALAREWLGT
jgi:tetratricopeptide (TPR) repeat protein